MSSLLKTRAANAKNEQHYPLITQISLGRCDAGVSGVEEDVIHALLLADALDGVGEALRDARDVARGENRGDVADADGALELDRQG